MPISIVENIDCMLGMKRFPDGFFDLAIPDPPYGINVGKMSFVDSDASFVKQRNGSTKRLKPKLYTTKDWDKYPPSVDYLNELKRVSKHQIIWGINYFAWKDIVGPGRIKWDKGVADGVSFKRYEYAYCSMIDTEMEFQLLHSGMMQAKSLKEPLTPRGNKAQNEKRYHPCQKPKLLYQWLLENFAQPGDVILDTHLGSGNSRIASYEMGFDFTGFEIDTEYFEVQQQRFLKETAKPLFE